MLLQDKTGSVEAAEFDPEYPISIDELPSKADALMYAQKRKRRKEESRLGVKNTFKIPCVPFRTELRKNQDFPGKGQKGNLK